MCFFFISFSFVSNTNKQKCKNGLNGYFRTLQGIFFLKVFQAFSKDFSHQYYVVGFLLKNTVLFKEPYNLNLFPMHMVLSKSLSKHRKCPVSQHLQSWCLQASLNLRKKYSPQLQAFCRGLFFFLPPWISQALHLIYRLDFYFPSKLHEEAKSWNLQLSTNWAVLLTPPVFSQCQTLCLDKTIYLYHFQAGQKGQGVGGAKRWRGEGKGDCFTCCQRALISPAVCWSQR